MDLNEKRMYVSISAGTLYLLVGIGQSIYAFMALVSVFFVNVLGLGLTVASVAVAAVPDKPIEVPYPRTLAITIAAVGAVFAVSCFAFGAICFFQRRISRVGLIACFSLCGLLGAIHFMNSLSFAVSMYTLVGLMLSAVLIVDWSIIKITRDRS